MSKITPPDEILNPEYKNKADTQYAVLFSLYKLFDIEDHGETELGGQDNIGLYFNAITREKIGPIKANEQIFGVIDGEEVTLSYDYNPLTEEEKDYKFKVLTQSPVIVPYKEKM